MTRSAPERRGSHRSRAGGAAARAAALVAAAFLAPAAARAQPEGRAELRLAAIRFAHAERGGAGPALAREEGWVPSVAGELALRGARLAGRAAARLARGTVTYDARTRSPGDPTLDGAPIRSRTDVSFVSGELEGGAFLDEGRRLEVLAALGARRWTRDLRDAGVVGEGGAPTLAVGYSEIYSWYELQAGLRWTILASPGTSWDVEARVVRTAGAEISVDLGKPFGIDATARMGLGARTGWRAATSVRQDLGAAAFLVLRVFADGYAFGASEPFVFRDASGVTRALAEPRSETWNGGIELGAGGRF